MTNKVITHVIPLKYVSSYSGFIEDNPSGTMTKDKMMEMDEKMNRHIARKIEEDERKRKIDAYFATLDPKKRQWEEKKLEHYRGTGKTYLLPGEKAEKDRRKALT